MWLKSCPLKAVKLLCEAILDGVTKAVKERVQVKTHESRLLSKSHGKTHKKDCFETNPSFPALLGKKPGLV